MKRFGIGSNGIGIGCNLHVKDIHKTVSPLTFKWMDFTEQIY